MYIEKNKKPTDIFSFLLMVFSLISFLFLVFFVIGMYYYSIYIGNEYNKLLPLLSLFLVPAILTVTLTYLIILLRFQYIYFQRKYIAQIKEFLSYLSLIIIIMPNTVNLFYVPETKQLLNNTYNGSFNIFSTEFLELFLEEINIRYSIPLFFVMFTFVLFLLEITKSISNPIRKIKVYPLVGSSISQFDIELINNLIHEAEKNLKQSREIISTLK